MEGFNFYRIKTEWLSEKEDKSLTKAKTEELVYASSYTEAEKVAYALVERYNRTQFGGVSIEIIKTRISELLWNNILATDDVLVAGLMVDFFEEDDATGVGMYQVKVMFTEVDPKTAKEKRTNENIFIPAASNSEAASGILAYLRKVGETRDYVIRDIRFDKAEAIIWPVEVHDAKFNAAVGV